MREKVFMVKYGSLNDSELLLDFDEKLSILHQIESEREMSSYQLRNVHVNLSEKYFSTFWLNYHKVIFIILMSSELWLEFSLSLNQLQQKIWFPFNVIFTENTNGIQ